ETVQDGETCSTASVPGPAAHGVSRPRPVDSDQLLIASLVVPFAMKLRGELPDRTREMSLPDRRDPIENTLPGIVKLTVAGAEWPAAWPVRGHAAAVTSSQIGRARVRKRR